MNEKRFVLALFGILLTVVLGFLAIKFVAALTVSVFLYYSTRRYYTFLGRLHVPRRIRAVIVLASLAVPLLLLISYSAVLLVLETRSFVLEYDLVGVAVERLPWLEGIESIPEFSVAGLYEAYQAGELDVFIDFAAENAPFVTDVLSAFFLNLFVVIVVTYYLLIDGSRVRAWLVRFDDDAIIREYLEAVDSELEAVLFGNLLNIIATALIAIGVYQGYNAFVPTAVEIPYPTLAGVLTGVASLIPVVGMKIVYFPLSAIAGLPIALGTADQSLFVYVVGFLALAIVVVDTIPDLILRPLLSGETTHVGLLMLAYTLGPVVLGFYGLFFAPILLVVFLTFADTALPRLLGAEPSEDDGIPADQLRLGDF
jgi:predicted PurR-regulated permease PerM